MEHTTDLFQEVWTIGKRNARKLLLTIFGDVNKLAESHRSPQDRPAPARTLVLQSETTVVIVVFTAWNKLSFLTEKHLKTHSLLFSDCSGLIVELMLLLSPNDISRATCNTQCLQALVLMAATALYSRSTILETA